MLVTFSIQRSFYLSYSPNCIDGSDNNYTSGEQSEALFFIDKYKFSYLACLSIGYPSNLLRSEGQAEISAEKSDMFLQLCYRLLSIFGMVFNSSVLRFAARENQKTAED